MRTDHNGKISKKTKIGYAGAAIGDACSYGFINSFLLYFLTSVVGINPAVAGMIAATGGIVDALCSPVVGYVSDKSTLRAGRRRPFLLVACFPLGIAITLLFRSIDAGGMVMVAYYGILTIMFWFFFALFFVPYLALGAEITNDYHERTVLRSYAYVFNFFGIMTGVVLPTYIVDHLCAAGETVEEAWQSAGMIVAVITSTSIFLTWYYTKGKEKEGSGSARHEDKNGHGKSSFFHTFYLMFKEYRQILSLKSLRYLIGSSMFFLFANTMITSDRMYFLIFNLGLSSDMLPKAYLICSSIGIVFVPVIIRASKLMDKRITFIACLIVSSAGMIAVHIIGVSSFLGFVVISFIFILGSSCYWQLLPAMIYDVCEVDELVAGQRREGIIMSLQSLSEAISAGISVQILGIILALAGFNREAAVQTQLTMDWIGNCFIIIPAIAMIASVFMIVKYPLTGKRYNMVLRALEKRAKGEECTEKKIEEIKKLF